MPKFKITVQFFKDFTIEAADKETAKKLVQKEAEELKLSEKLNVCAPKDLDLAAQSAKSSKKGGDK